MKTLRCMIYILVVLGQVAWLVWQNYSAERDLIEAPRISLPAEGTRHRVKALQPEVAQCTCTAMSLSACVNGEPPSSAFDKIKTEADERQKMRDDTNESRENQ